MSRARRPVVYVFARQPVLGAVKRRLAAGIGDLGALAFYRCCCRRLLHRIGGDGRWRTVLAVTPDKARARGVWPPGLPRAAQGTGSLGRRMERVLDALADAPALIVGSDIPDLTAVHLAAALRALGSSDFVFGPASDGGYWLVGRAAGVPVRGLFADVRWSGPRALADTLANIPRHRRCAFLDTLEDIDDVATFGRWRSRNAASARRPSVSPGRCARRASA